MFAEAISCDRPSIIYIKGINNYPWTRSGQKVYRKFKQGKNNI